jgi:hypothetical protein
MTITCFIAQRKEDPDESAYCFPLHDTQLCNSCTRMVPRYPQTVCFVLLTDLYQQW